MHAIVYAPFAVSAVLVALSALVCRTAAPRMAAWTLVGAMLVVAGTFAGALALLAWPLFARDALIAHVGRWNPGAVGAGVPVPLAVSVGAFLALSTIAFRVVRVLRSMRSDYVESATIHRGLPMTSSSVVVVEDPLPVAHALPRTILLPGRVIVSSGLLAALDADERAAVLAHEHAHLRHGHRVFTVAGALATAMNPLLTPVRNDLAFVLERWADEDAVVRTSRGTTARALTKAALAQLSAARRGTAAATVALHLGHLGVVRRVSALSDEHAQRRRSSMVWLTVAVGIVAIAAVAWGAHDTERLFEALRSH